MRAGKRAQNKRDMDRKHTIQEIKAGKHTQKKIDRARKRNQNEKIG
jgi:hypothetical protein